MDVQSQQFQLMLSEQIRSGRYANGIDVTQYRDETLIDFQLVHPARGHGETVARIVVSNQFLSELSNVLNQIVAQTKKEPATEHKPVNRQFGFKAPSESQ